MASDRLFGLVAILVALAFIASATQLQVSFFADPVGAKAFPMLIGGLILLCGGYMVLKPDADPDWPRGGALARIAAATLVMVAYAYALQPGGFLIPTAIAAAVISWMIRADTLRAVLTGLGLSVGLFLIFRYALGLNLLPFPRGMIGG
jgi:putative tricarboxylic transport membrane protein